MKPLSVGDFRQLARQRLPNFPVGVSVGLVPKVALRV